MNSLFFTGESRSSSTDAGANCNGESPQPTEHAGEIHVWHTGCLRSKRDSTNISNPREDQNYAKKCYVVHIVGRFLSVGVGRILARKAGRCDLLRSAEGCRDLRSDPASVWAAQGAKFHGDDDLISAPFQRAAHQHFVMTHAVEVASIDEVDAAIQSGMDRGDALIFVRVPINTGHPHASQRNRENLRAVRAEGGR